MGRPFCLPYEDGFIAKKIKQLPVIQKLLIQYLAGRSRQNMYSSFSPNSFVSLCIHSNSLKFRLLSQFFEDSGDSCFQHLQKDFRQSMFVLLGLVPNRGANKLCHGFGRDAGLRHFAHGVGQRPCPFLELFAGCGLPRLAEGVHLPLVIICKNNC